MRHQSTCAKAVLFSHPSGTDNKHQCWCECEHDSVRSRGNDHLMMTRRGNVLPSLSARPACAGVSSRSTVCLSQYCAIPHVEQRVHPDKSKEREQNNWVRCVRYLVDLPGYAWPTFASATARVDCCHHDHPLPAPDHCGHESASGVHQHKLVDAIPPRHKS